MKCYQSSCHRLVPHPFYWWTNAAGTTLGCRGYPTWSLVLQDMLSSSARNFVKGRTKKYLLRIHPVNDHANPREPGVWTWGTRCRYVCSCYVSLLLHVFGMSPRHTPGSRGSGGMWKDKKQQTEGSTTSQSAAVFTECSGVAEKWITASEADLRPCWNAGIRETFLSQSHSSKQRQKHSSNDLMDGMQVFVVVLLH